jgi:DNA-binding PadR family transcriptional regulator
MKLPNSLYDIVHLNYMSFEPGTWEIAVLTLLREAPMHPYQMQRLLHLRHKDEILVLKRGSLYHAIRRLAENRLIDVERTGREGRRPERTIYRITSAGTRALIEALRRIVATPKREPSDCMAAMSFLVHLEPGEACALLGERAKNLEAEVDQVISRLADAKAHVDRINLIESEYLLAMIKAERAWVRTLEKEIREGILTWDLKEILREAAASRKAASQARK